MFQVNTTYDNYVNDLLIDDDYVVEENEFINLNGKLVRKIIYTNQSKSIIKHGLDINKKFVIEYEFVTNKNNELDFNELGKILVFDNLVK